MSKLQINVDLDKLTPKEKTEFLRLIDKSNNPFARVDLDDKYYYVNGCGEVEEDNDSCYSGDEAAYNCHNYYNDEKFAEHQALRELLNRKLMKFSYENGGNEIKGVVEPISIFYDEDGRFKTNIYYLPDILTPLFISEEVAQRAIDKIIEPFMKEHPDFKFWG